MLARTVSGNPPPTGFLVTLWILAIAFLLLAAIGPVAWWRARGTTRPEERGRATCLVVTAVPSAMLGLFLLSWAIAIS